MHWRFMSWAAVFRSVAYWGGLCVLAGLITTAPDPACGQSFVGRLHTVRDGDTVELIRPRAGSRIVVVKLWGVDAPELGQPYGAAARQALHRYLHGRRVRVLRRGEGEDGRVRSILRVDGDAVERELLREGLVWWDQRAAPSEEAFRRLEQAARRAERGLWAQPTPTPPWEWRSDHEGAG